MPMPFRRTAALTQQVYELRTQVSRLEEMVESLLTHQGLSLPASKRGLVESLVDDEVRRLAAAGKKIEAIKLVRERTGLGLKEANDIVDRL